MPPSASERILHRIQERLCAFGLYHSTIQFEHVLCQLSDQGCNMAAAEPGHHHHHH